MATSSKARGSVAAAPASEAAALAARLDGWSNVLTGLGRMGVDKRVSSRFEGHDPLSLDRAQLEAMFQQDDLARRIVEHVPQEMVREWYDIRVDEDPEIAELAAEELDRLGARRALLEGLCWSRLYGGALWLIGADDGQPFDLPLNVATLRRVMYLQPLDRWHVSPEGYDEDPQSPTFYQPLHYLLRGGQRVHHSRVWRFDGALVPTDVLRRTRWHDSILEAAYRTLLNFSTGQDGAATALQDFAVNVLGVKDLSVALAKNGTATVARRVQAMQTTMSMMRTVLIDSQGETFQRLGQPLSGVSDILERMENRVAMAARMPRSILFGNQQGAVAGAGNDTRSWYATIQADQRTQAVPPLRRVLELVFAAKDGPFVGVPPKAWKVEPRPLWSPTEKEIAEARKIQADTDAVYIDKGVVAPMEIRSSRFGGAGYSMDTVLDAAMDAILAAADAPPDLEPDDGDPPARAKPEDPEEPEEPEEPGEAEEPGEPGDPEQEG
jgi:phage-related protein (TIGR01555 family)